MHHARSVSEAFDVICYKKGSAVIRMLQGYLGNDLIQVTKLNDLLQIDIVLYRVFHVLNMSRYDRVQLVVQGERQNVLRTFTLF